MSATILETSQRYFTFLFSFIGVCNLFQVLNFFFLVSFSSRYSRFYSDIT